MVTGRASWTPRFALILGNELRELRRQHRLYRWQLLKLVDDEICYQTLATYELGTRRITVERFVELVLALEESPVDILARVLGEVFGEVDQGIMVDLVAASQLGQPELSPLRAWAVQRLAGPNPDGSPKVVRLDVDAVAALAVVCGMDAAELRSLLPQPGLRSVRTGREVDGETRAPVDPAPDLGMQRVAPSFVPPRALRVQDDVDQSNHDGGCPQ